MRVRVAGSGTATKLHGRVGTVAHVYGSPSCVAVDVRFGDGLSDLFWYYELVSEDATQDPARMSSRQEYGVV